MLLLVKRELLSAAAPRSCARLVLDSGLPLLVKKVRSCDRVVRGTRLHNGKVLEEMCEMRDTDAACRGSMLAAEGAAVRVAEQLYRNCAEGYQLIKGSTAYPRR